VKRGGGQAFHSPPCKCLVIRQLKILLVIEYRENILRFDVVSFDKTIHNIDINHVAALVVQLKGKLRQAGITIKHGTTTLAGLIDGIHEIRGLLDRRVEMSPKEGGPPDLDTLKTALSTSREFLDRLRETPAGEQTSKYGESIELLKAAVTDQVNGAIAYLKTVEFSAPATTDQVIAEFFPQYQEQAEEQQSTNNGNQEKKPKEVEMPAASELISREELREDYGPKRLPPMWESFLRENMLAIRPVVYHHGKLIDLHELYKRHSSDNTGGWSEYKINERDLERSKMMFHMMHHEMRRSRDRYTDPNSFMPSISYKTTELNQGIPSIPGFAPSTVQQGSRELTVERSIFGFYRIKGVETLSEEADIRVVYHPNPHDCYEDRSERARSKLEAFFAKMITNLAPERVPLTNEAYDEIKNPEKNVDWSVQLTRLIIALNMGLADFPRANISVGTNFTSHMAGRRIGTEYDTAILVSNMLSQLGKPNFLTLGLYVEEGRPGVEVWQYRPDKEPMLKIMPQLYSSEHNKQQYEQAQAADSQIQQDCIGPNAAYNLGLIIRDQVPGINYKIDPGVSYEKFLFDKRDDHMHFMMRDIMHTEDRVLCHTGRVPLRVQVDRCVRRLSESKRCDQLLLTYFIRRAEIDGKIAYRIENGAEIDKGPADACVELLKAAFRHDQVAVQDLAATDEEMCVYRPKKQYSAKIPVGAKLLELSDAKLEYFKTSRQGLYTLLRQSPSVIDRVINSTGDNFLSDSQNKKRLSRAEVKEQLLRANVLLDILTLEPLAQFDTEKWLEKDEALTQLCVSLVEIYALGIKLQDTELREKAKKGFRALGAAYGEHMSPTADYDIFNLIQARCVKDHHLDQAFHACLVELTKTNQIFSRNFVIDEKGDLQSTTEGAMRLSNIITSAFDCQDPKSPYYRDSYDGPDPFLSAVDYLHFLHLKALVPESTIHEVSEVTRKVVTEGYIGKELRINPPLSVYPISQLQFLRLLEDRHRRKVAHAVLQLIDIGVINDEWQTENAKIVEDRLARNLVVEEPRMDSERGSHIGASCPKTDETPKGAYFSVPIESVMSASRDLHLKLPAATRTFLTWHRDLVYKREEYGEAHSPSFERRSVNYQDALLSLATVYPQVANALFEAAKNKANKVFFNGRRVKYCSLSDQEHGIRLAVSLLQVSILERFFSGEFKEVPFRHFLRDLEARVRQFGATFDSQANGERPKFMGELNGNLLIDSPIFQSRFPEMSEFIPLIVATTDRRWIRGVFQAINDTEKHRAFLDYDICGGKLQGISNPEKAVRAMLLTDFKNSALDIDAVKRMAKSVERQMRRRSPLVVSGQQLRGDYKGRSPSNDRTADFSHFQELVVPDAQRIDWKLWARTDRFYERRTISGENRTETIIINIGSNRTLAVEDWRSQPTKTLGKLISVLNDNGHITPNTRFAVQSHGIPVAYFSVAELLQGACPILALDKNSSELTTPIERLIGALTVAHCLTASQNLLLMREGSSLLQHSHNTHRYHRQRIVLVTETDSALGDIQSIRSFLKGGDSALYECNNDTKEITF
jgi:hypothetical protein